MSRGRYLQLHSSGGSGAPNTVYHSTQVLFQNAALGKHRRSMATALPGCLMSYRETRHTIDVLKCLRERDCLEQTVSGDDSFVDVRHWNDVADEWLRMHPQTVWRAHSDAVNATLLARWLPDGRTGLLLKTDLFDEAVGDGLYPLLASRAQGVVGTDVSILTLRAARSHHAGLQVVCADVRYLPFADGACDVVVSNSTLDHFATREEIVAALREIHRVLRLDGCLLLTLDNLANPVVALSRYCRFAC